MCGLIIITAGRNRSSGETRLNLINDNVKILKDIIMAVSNPVDILTYLVTEWMDFLNGKVFGTGCILDTSRFVRALADYISLSIEVVKGFVVGEHGDSQIPIWVLR